MTMKLLIIAAGMLILLAFDKHDDIRTKRIAQLEAMADCRPQQDGQIAALTQRNGVTECAITDQVGGRRRVVERRTM